MSVAVAAPVNPAPPGRCGFFVERKKRFCKMIVAKGNEFCGEHANVENGNSRRRIPCPLDPKHTVFEERLSKHLKKCNSREKPTPVYYEKDVNAGSDDEEILKDKVCLGHRSKAELDLNLEKLKKALEGLDLTLDQSVLSHPVLFEELNNTKNGDSALKHLKQQASILGNMEEMGLLGPSRCFVEFGAGKGKLSHWIHEAVKLQEGHHFVLVERSSTRFKVDGKHQQVDATFERLQVDIQHLDLGKFPLIKEKRIPIVGVGKHLCGSATDLALRCLLERSDHSLGAEPPCKRPRPSEEPTGVQPSVNSEPAAPPSGIEVFGVAVALCCHHRCDWRHYVGKHFFTQKGLGAAEFTVFQRMSSWATCGLRIASEGCPDNQSSHLVDDGEHKPADQTDLDSFNGVLSADERQRFGRLCKLLIDQGRVDYLQKKGFTAKLVCYTNTETTLENVLLMAVPAVKG